MNRRLVALALTGALLGCHGSYEVEAGEHCRQAGYSIAARIQSCTQDEARANAAYERFVANYTCLGSPKTEANYRCAIDLNALPCDDVLEYGDELDRFISDTPRCHVVIGGWTPVTTPVVDCAALAEAMAPKIASCVGTEDYVELVGLLRKRLGLRGCVEPQASALDACKAELAALDCSAAEHTDDALSWAAVAPACDALLEEP